MIPEKPIGVKWSWAGVATDDGRRTRMPGSDFRKCPFLVSAQGVEDMKSLRRWRRALPAGLALLGLLWLGQSWSAGQQTAAKKVATVEGITEYQLDNGFRYLLLPDP